MAKRFTIVYPDRSKKNVSASDKEQMSLAGEIRPTSDPRMFAFIGVVKTYHNIQDWAAAYQSSPQINPILLRRFLEGHYLRKGFEPIEREVPIGPCLGDINRPTHHEYMESEHGLGIRVRPLCPEIPVSQVQI